MKYSAIFQILLFVLLCTNKCKKKKYCVLSRFFVQKTVRKGREKMKAQVNLSRYSGVFVGDIAQPTVSFHWKIE